MEARVCQGRTARPTAHGDGPSYHLTFTPINASPWPILSKTRARSASVMGIVAPSARIQGVKVSRYTAYVGIAYRFIVIFAIRPFSRYSIVYRSPDCTIKPLESWTCWGCTFLNILVASRNHVGDVRVSAKRGVLYRIEDTHWTRSFDKSHDIPRGAFGIAL